MAIGPQLPPHLQQQPYRPPDVEGDDDDDYVPELPPDMAPAKSQRPAPSPPRAVAPAPARQPQRPIPGPSLPPPAYDDDSEDEDVGPRPLPAHLQHDEEDGVRALIEREERKAKNLEESKKPKKLERQEWMLKPPTSSDLLGSLDPTKLQGKRTFNKGTTDARAMADNLWTETPQERQKRIQDEVMGKKRRAAEAAADPDGDRDSAKRRKHDEELRRAIQGHASRAESLVDMHERTLADKPTEKDDEIWNHDRDISKGKLPMDASSRKKLITDARGLSDRFGSGKSGSFL